MENTATGCQKFTAGLSSKICFPLLQNEFSLLKELLRLAVVHHSSNKLFLTIELVCHIVSVCLVLNIVSAQHPPQSSTFSPAVLRHETLLTVILTMWCEMRVRSGWVVSMMLLLAKPALLFFLTSFLDACFRL